MTKKRQSNLLLLSKHEQGVLVALDYEGKRSRDLKEQTGIPHASLYLALEKLVTRGLARRKRNNHKVWWFRNDPNEVSTDINLLQQEITGLSGARVVGETGEIVVNKGIQAVRESILEMTALPKGARVTIYQSATISDNLVKIFSAKDLEAINKALSKENLLFQSIIPDDYFKKLEPVFGLKWLESYKDRANRLTHVPSRFNMSPAEFHVYPKHILIVDYDEIVSIKVTHPETVRLVRGLLEYIQEIS